MYNNGCLQEQCAAKKPFPLSVDVRVFLTEHCPLYLTTKMWHTMLAMTDLLFLKIVNCTERDQILFQILFISPHPQQ